MITNTQATPIIVHNLTTEMEELNPAVPSSLFDRWFVQRLSERITCKLGKNDGEDATSVAHTNRRDVVKASAKYDTQPQIDVELNRDMVIAARNKKGRTVSKPYVCISLYQKNQLQHSFQQNDRPSREEIDEIVERIAINPRKVKMWFASERYRCKASRADLNEQLETVETPNDAAAKNKPQDVNGSAATSASNRVDTGKNYKRVYVHFSVQQKNDLLNFFQQNIYPSTEELSKFAKHANIEFERAQRWFAATRCSYKKAYFTHLSKLANRSETFKAPRDATGAVTQINKAKGFAARENLIPKSSNIVHKASIAASPNPVFSDTAECVNYRDMHRIDNPLLPAANSMMAYYTIPYLYPALSASQTVYPAVSLPYTTVRPADIPSETSFSHNVPLVESINKETQKTEEVIAEPTEMEFSESLKYIDVKLDEEKEDRVAARAKNESLDVNDSAVTATNNTSEAEASEKNYVSFSIPQKKKLWSFFQKSDCHTKEEVSNFAKRTNMKFEKVQRWLKIERQRCFLADLNEPAPKRLETFKAPSDAACAVTQINKSEDFATSKNITPQSPDVTDRASIAGNLSPMFYDTTGSVNHRYMHSTGNPLSVADSMMAYANPYLYSVLAAGQTVPSVVGLPYATSFSHSVPLAGTIKKETQKTEKVMVDNVTKSTEMEISESLRYQVTSMPVFPQWQPY